MQVNVTALFTTAQVELITEAVARRRAELHLGLRRPDRRRRASTRCRSWRESVEIMRDAPRAELIWASPREILNVVQADQVGCHIITMTHDLLAEARARSARTSSSSRSRPSRCSTATPSRPASRSSRMRRALHHRRRRVHRQHARRPAAGATASRSSILDDFRTGRREFVAGALATGARLRRGRRARPARARATRSPAATRSSTCRPTPTCATGSSTRGATSSRTRSPPSNVLEAMRAAGVDDDRVLLDRLGLRRARGVPDARGRAVPGPDLALRGVQARRRGADRRLRHGFGFTGLDLPLRLDPRRALHARPRDRLLPRAAGATRRACACSATAARRSPTCTCRTACRRSSTAVDHARGRRRAAHVYNLGTDETIVVDESIAMITAPPRRRAARSSTRGGTRGWAGDSPLIHLDTQRASGRSAGSRS